MFCVNLKRMRQACFPSATSKIDKILLAEMKKTNMIV